MSSVPLIHNDNQRTAMCGLMRTAFIMEFYGVLYFDEM